VIYWEPPETRPGWHEGLVGKNYLGEKKKVSNRCETDLNFWRFNLASMAPVEGWKNRLFKLDMLDYLVVLHLSAHIIRLLHFVDHFASPFRHCHFFVIIDPIASILISDCFFFAIDHSDTPTKTRPLLLFVNGWEDVFLRAEASA
jgi:hypothetical protein